MTRQIAPRRPSSAGRLLSRAYATTPFADSVDADGHVVSRPNFPVHAKDLGTMSTLCGLSTLSWVKVFNRPFETLEDGQCSDCLRVIRQRSR